MHCTTRPEVVACRSMRRARSRAAELAVAAAAGLWLCVMAVLPASLSAQEPVDDLQVIEGDVPTVLVLATGGTIAGVQDQPGGIAGYRAGTLGAEEIVASVPGITDYANIETEQFMNVPSPRITPDDRLRLARRINELLTERDDLAGIVVTHGTDRMEETAFFLYLTVRSDKPVVIVGSQRPATGLSPDGPINLLAAVRTAASPQAVGKGVVVVMDDRILSGREVRKLYQRVGGFSTGEMGMLGVVGRPGPEFFFAPTRRHGPDSEFDLEGVESVPWVDLTISHPDGRGPHYPDEVPAGIVVSTNGFTCAESSALLSLQRKGTVVVTVFPSGDNVGGRGGAVRDSVPQSTRERCADTPPAEGWDGPSYPTISAEHLTAHKARILLMVALAHTRDRAELSRIFREY